VALGAATGSLAWGIAAAAGSATRGAQHRRHGERIIRRLQNLFARAGTETEDIDILRGFFNTVKKRLDKNRE